MVRRQVGAALAVLGVASLVYAGAVVKDSAGEETKRRQTTGATTSTMRVLDWNVCGESGGCPSAGKTDQQVLLAEQIKNLAVNKNAEAVFLQEVCGDDDKNDRADDPAKTADKSLVTHLGEKLGTGWSIAFLPYTRPAESRFGTSTPFAPYPAPIPTSGSTAYPPRSDSTPPYTNPPTTADFRCRGPERIGVQGIAIAVKGTFGEREEFELHSPAPALWLKALCVRRTSGGTPARLCTSHLTPKADDRDHRAGFSYRAEQVQRLVEIIGDGQDTIFGGDFNSRPPDDSASGADSGILAPLYAKYRECEQGSGTVRKGSGTMWSEPSKGPDPSASPVITRTDRKYDYLFSKSSFTSCEVLSNAELKAWSDHLPVVGTATVTTG
ncbi:endonuclease/exonuclease/phosphatase family protein [Streptomyces sp. NPDC059875]|uniref:endonuclease/exonuclease/phosphatase family protein n=1 Tax=unclassified Streptomyces TaxID=2593676 RepID=UPI003648D5D4